jgi:hypothetical protein
VLEGLRRVEHAQTKTSQADYRIAPAETIRWRDEGFGRIGLLEDVAFVPDGADAHPHSLLFLGGVVAIVIGIGLDFAAGALR